MQNDELKALFRQVFDNENGRDVLYSIYKQCGPDKTSIYQTPDGKIETNATLYNEGRRSIWLDIRKLLPNHTLEYVEIRAAINEAKTNKLKTEG